MTANQPPQPSARMVQWHEGPHYWCDRCHHTHYLRSRVGIRHHNRNREAILWAMALATRRRA